MLSSVMIVSAIGLAACSSNAGSSGANTSSSPANVSSAPNPTAGRSSQMNDVSMRELLTSPTPHQCTVTYDDQSAHMTATIDLANGMMRGDYNTAGGGQTMVAHTIMKDNVEYTWIDGQSQGYKMPADSGSQGSLSDQKGPASGQIQGTGPNMDQKMAYHCNAWSVDLSMFVPPAGINFMDLTNMRQYMPSGN